MNIASVACIGQRSACAVRATRLDTDCSPLAGDNNSVVTAALVTLTATPEVEEGTRFEPKNACGDILFTAENPDVVKRYTIEAEFGLHDLALFELLTDATAMLGSVTSSWSGKIIGVETPGSQSVHSNGVALEIWTKTASGTGPCGAVEDLPPYERHIFPRMVLRPGDRTFADDVAMMKFSGWAAPNGQWGEGPYGDWLATDPLSGITPYAHFFDTTLPTTDCGYGSVSSA